MGGCVVLRGRVRLISLLRWLFSAVEEAVNGEELSGHVRHGLGHREKILKLLRPLELELRCQSQQLEMIHQYSDEDGQEILFGGGTVQVRLDHNNECEHNHQEETNDSEDIQVRFGALRAFIYGACPGITNGAVDTKNALVALIASAHWIVFRCVAAARMD